MSNIFDMLIFSFLYPYYDMLHFLETVTQFLGVLFCGFHFFSLGCFSLGSFYFPVFHFIDSALAVSSFLISPSNTFFIWFTMSVIPSILFWFTFLGFPSLCKHCPSICSFTWVLFFFIRALNRQHSKLKFSDNLNICIIYEPSSDDSLYLFTLSFVFFFLLLLPFKWFLQFLIESWIQCIRLQEFL